MNTDRPIPHGEIVGYTHTDEDGEIHLEIANLVTPPIMSVEQLMSLREERDDDD